MKGVVKMAESIYELLKKRGVVVPEHHIQPLKAHWDTYQLLNNNPNPNKLPGYHSGYKHVSDEA